VLRRFLLPTAVLAGILLLGLAHLVANGRRAREVVAENLPHRPLSSGTRDIDLWHPTTSFGHVYDLTFAWPEPKPWSVPAGSRLEVQLSSGGRTRLLIVRKGHPNDTPSWGSVLTGRLPLQVVGDREWVDLGPFPSEGTRLEVQVYGLLPGAFGFAEQNEPGTAHFSGFRIRRPDSPLARPSRTIVRYRFVVSRPVDARETLARALFFVSASRVLQLTLAVALVLLLLGWAWLWQGRTTRAAAALVPAVTLLHACALPPFQGADAVNHVGTVEALLFNPALFGGPWAYPKSLATVYDAIGYDRFASHPDVPVPLTSPAARDEARAVLTRPALDEAHAAVSKYLDAGLLDPRSRAPLFYAAFRLFGPVARHLSVLDRIEAYVVLSAAGSLVLFGLGLLLLARAELGSYVALAYALVALVPYSVGVAASCSNYSPAIGLGALLAASALVTILADEARVRLLGAELFLGGSALGVTIWDDFVFLAAGGILALVAILLVRAFRRGPESARPRAAVLAGVFAVLLAATFWALSSGRAWRLLHALAARRPKHLGGPDDPTFWVLLGTAAVPFVIALLFAFFLLRARDVPEPRRLAWARGRSALGAAIFLVMFLATRWSGVPFEQVRLDLSDEVAAHWAAFWSNNFAWDQDVLAWKMYWGVFGYADVSYPDAIYAVARWACVALFLALPVLSVRFTTRRPIASAQLLLVSGFALSVCVVTNSIRHLQPALPWGRFLLPLLPLAALPVLVRTEVPGRERAAAWLLAAAVVLHLWTSVALLPSRYAVGI
jgi:hypothetical protein